MMVRTLLGCQRYTAIHLEPRDSLATAYAAPPDLQNIDRFSLRYFPILCIASGEVNQL